MATRSGKIRGGLKAKAYLHKIRAARSLSRSVRVGFFREARYTNGVSVARVATIHEFGSGPFKERPFFRTALKGADKVLLPVMKQTINPRTMVFDNITAGHVGLAMASLIQLEVTKFGVIDTGKLRRSVSWVGK